LKFQTIRHWNFIGVMRNSAVASGMSSRTQSSRGGNRTSAERIINIDVRGATRMFNYWANAYAGDHLFLVWRAVLLDERHGVRFPVASNDPVDMVILPAGWAREVHDGKVMYKRGTLDANSGIWTYPPGSLTQAGMPVGTQRLVHQLLPYTNGENYRHDKIWWNEQAIVGRSMQRPICVGFVHQSLGAGETSDSHIAIRKATMMVSERFKLPMIHSFLHV